MKMIINVVLVVLAFTWASGGYAGNWSKKQSPESIVTCSSLDYTYLVLHRSVSSSINLDACAVESQCNPCIESLENQGCKIIDLKLDHLLRDVGDEADWPQAFASYSLSCKKP